MDPFAIPEDTSSEAYWAEIEACRRMTERERLEIVFRLMEYWRRRTQAVIRQRHPEYSDDQVFLAYVRLKLGDELTTQVWPGRPLVDP